MFLIFLKNYLHLHFALVDLLRGVYCLCPKQLASRRHSGGGAGSSGEAEKEAAETRALFSFLSNYSLGGGGGGKGGGGCDDDDDDVDDDPNGMHDDGPSENEEPAKEDAANGKPEEADTIDEAILRSEHGYHGFCVV